MAQRTLLQRVLWKNRYPLTASHLYALQDSIDAQSGWLFRKRGEVGVASADRSSLSMAGGTLVVKNLSLLMPSGVPLDIETLNADLDPPNGPSLVYFVMPAHAGPPERQEPEWDGSATVPPQFWRLVPTVAYAVTSDADALAVCRVEQTPEGTWSLDPTFIPMSITLGCHPRLAEVVESIRDDVRKLLGLIAQIVDAPLTQRGAVTPQHQRFCAVMWHGLSTILTAELNYFGGSPQRLVYAFAALGDELREWASRAGHNFNPGNRLSAAYKSPSQLLDDLLRSGLDPLLKDCANMLKELGDLVKPPDVPQPIRALRDLADWSAQEDGQEFRIRLTLRIAIGELTSEARGLTLQIRPADPVDLPLCFVQESPSDTRARAIPATLDADPWPGGIECTLPPFRPRTLWAERSVIDVWMNFKPVDIFIE